MRVAVLFTSYVSPPFRSDDGRETDLRRLLHGLQHREHALRRSIQLVEVPLEVHRDHQRCRLVRLMVPRALEPAEHLHSSLSSVPTLELRLCAASRCGFPKSCGPHSFHTMKYSFRKLPRNNSPLLPIVVLRVVHVVLQSADRVRLVAPHAAPRIHQPLDRARLARHTHREAPQRDLLQRCQRRELRQVGNRRLPSRRAATPTVSSASSRSMASCSGWPCSACSGAVKPQKRCSSHVPMVSR